LTSAVQAVIAVGRAMRAADPLPDASPWLVFELRDPAGELLFDGHLSWLGAERVVAVLEAAAAVQHRRPAAPTRPRLHLVRNP
jgi:hypothetical protein